ncbi:beta-propeller fold lactonase family protein [Spirosoma telluris]|uniref:beta-propeller fold lactonase family protein n=1 Tax=Spirosoma telluris TaxID=2183553 RepID=UPI0018DBD911
MKNLLLTGFLCLIAYCGFGQTDDYYLYVGTYTRKTSEGIYVYRFNTNTGDFSPLVSPKG